MFDLPVEKQIILLYAAINGYVDEYPESGMNRYETELFNFIEGKHMEILSEAREKKEIDGELEEKIISALSEFKVNLSI